MQNIFSWVNIGGRLPNSDIGAFLSVNKLFHSLDHGIWSDKLECEFGILPFDHEDHPRKLYRRLLEIPQYFDILCEVIDHGDLPAIKYLVSKGLLEWKDEKAAAKWNEFNTNIAAGNGHLKVVKYFVSLGIPPDQWGTNIATERGHLDVVKYLVSLGMRPTIYGAIWAAINMDTKPEMVQYLVSLGLLPHEVGTDWEHNKSHLDHIKYFYLFGMKPNPKAANGAAQRGYLDIVQHFASMDILPTQQGAYTAAIKGHVEVVKYLASIGIFPTPNSADVACKSGHVEVVKYLVSIGIGPSQQGIDDATINGHLNMVKYLCTQLVLPEGDPFLPRPEAVNAAAERNRADVVEFLGKLA